MYQSASAQQQEEQTVRAAMTVFNESMASQDNKIPQAMLADAHGVAIIPNVIKGSFVVGARHGKGVLMIREADGVWHAPVFITLTGGNVGWQVGLQASDIILVFKTPRSIQGILSGKLTLGADASAAAGPVGRETAAATDGKLQAEIYTYSRARGLFAGVSIDGSVVRIDQLATGAYYQNPAPGQPVNIPASAQQLTQTVASYAVSAPGPTPSAPGTPLASATPAPVASSATLNAPVNTTPLVGAKPMTAAPPASAIVQQQRASDADVLRNQLVELSPEMYELMDDKWKEFLALPSAMFLTGPHPSSAEVAATVEKFNRVATDPAFAQLAARPEFQSVYGILKHYQQSLNPAPATLQLPQPPTSLAVPAR
jgi:lipid-binding SYLF domain-containing protein